MCTLLGHSEFVSDIKKRYYSISAMPYDVSSVYLPISNKDILWTVVRLICWCCPTCFSTNDKIGVTGVDVVLNVKIIRQRLKHWIVLICARLEIGTALKNIQ